MEGLMRKAQIAIVVAELGMLAFAIFAFWIFIEELDAIEYGMLYVWGLMPFTSFITSLVTGMLRIWNRYGALWPALCAVLISLLPYVTFDTAYVLHSGNLLVPDLTMSIGGCAVSYAGFVTGTIVRTTKKV